MEANDGKNPEYNIDLPSAPFPTTVPDDLSERMQSTMFSKDFVLKKNKRNVVTHGSMIRTQRANDRAIANDRSVCCVVACCDSQANVYVEDEHYSSDRDSSSATRKIKTRF